MSAVAHPMLRWSSVRDCARKATYEAVGAPARERTDREERILFRGRRIGRDYADLIAHRHGENAIKRERKVVWQLGVGHADIYLKETRTIVEVLSSAHASDEMIQSKLLQLVGYIEHDPEAENGVLVILNPSDYSEERLIVSPSSEQYAALVVEMHDRIAQVQRWDVDGVLPARVCGKPADARSHFCLYAETCFAGWQPPPVEQIAADLEVVTAAARLLSTKGARRELAAADKLLEAEQKDAQRILEQAELPAGAVQVGPYEVKRTPVQRKPTFQWERAELAGVFEPGLYDGFFKDGARYSLWDVEKTGENLPLPDDEEVPF